MSGEPFPSNVPPHEPLYHCKVVPEPPDAVNVTVPEPAHTDVGLAEADVGATGAGVTVTVVLAQAELPHELVQRAKYWVVVTGAAITSGDPLPIDVSPQEPMNHCNVEPDPPEAVKVTVPDPAHTDVGLAEADVGATGAGVTVTVVLAHPELPHELVQRAKY